ncbi:MAG: hypothetical protein IJV35_04375 [Neisseriaceae bacterium]|nr:hypothetical protein [Neisseriaceae bacterium]
MNGVEAGCQTRQKFQIIKTMKSNAYRRCFLFFRLPETDFIIASLTKIRRGNPVKTHR